MVRRLALLGATGSIGGSTIDVVREQREHISITLASANTNVSGLLNAAREFGIGHLVLCGELGTAQKALAMREADSLSARIYFGEEELLKVLNDLDYEIGLNALSGSSGLRSTIAILKRGKDLALANKESLVMAGEIVTGLIKQHGSRLIPVDSEHSALFQALGNHPGSEVRKLWITASGGAFRNTPLEDFGKITKEQALKHPNWNMGAKVTIDSATMFNKVLEITEAHYLFGIDYDRIDAVMHPQSIIHSLVEFIDGSFLAQLSSPDMRLPILYALSYPKRWKSELVKTDMLNLQELSFRALEEQRYPLFFLGIEVARKAGTLTTIMNAANEAAHSLFLKDRISFIQIPELIKRTLDSFENTPSPNLEEILAVNREAYAKAMTLADKL